MALVDTLLSAVLPVLTIAGVGYGFATYRDINPDALSTISLYILLPALVFHSLVTSEISTQVTLAAFAGVFGFVIFMFGLTEGVSRLTGIDGARKNALVLTVIFPNVGNYGLPLADFAFGAIGRQTAVIFVIGQSVLMYSLGVYVASRRSGQDATAAFRRIFHLPMIYAVIAAVVLRVIGWVPSQDLGIMEAIALTGDATIPVMLLILGMELARLQRGTDFWQLFQASSLILVAGPVVAFGIGLLLNLPTAVLQPFVLLGAMPAAITPLLLLIEFDDGNAEGTIEFASAVIFITTILSIATLSLIIFILQ